jgi:hypothetical protein
MASHHPRSSVVTPEALEEAHRNVWLVLKAHGWEPEQELDMDIAQTLVVLANLEAPLPPVRGFTALLNPSSASFLPRVA